MNLIRGEKYQDGMKNRSQKVQPSLFSYTKHGNIFPVQSHNRKQCILIWFLFKMFDKYIV